MNQRKSQAGFSAIEFIIVVIVVAALAAAGYVVYNRQNNDGTATQPTNTQTVSTDVPSAPTISSTADLDSASAVLDQIDPSTSNTSDSTQLDSQLSAF